MAIFGKGYVSTSIIQSKILIQMHLCPNRLFLSMPFIQYPLECSSVLISMPHCYKDVCFLVACTQLYNLLYPSLCPSVFPSLCNCRVMRFEDLRNRYQFSQSEHSTPSSEPLSGFRLLTSDSAIYEPLSVRVDYPPTKG